VHLTTQYLYDRGPTCVTCTSGALCMSGRPFVHGFNLYLEKATVLYSSDGKPLTVLAADGKQEQPNLAGGDDSTTAFTSELQAAVDGIARGKESHLLSGRLARDALVMCHRECESVLTGRAVRL